MITHNPYSLPDKILKPAQITKPIALQNKKSRDRSYDHSKQISSKGIKIQSQMKKSLNLQHITSSPNLHTPSTSSSTNRPIEPPSLPRPVEYHQTHILPNTQSQSDRRIKFLFEKFYQMAQQITNHDSIINKLVNQKQKSDRNSWDSPFELNQRQSRDKDDMMRNQARSFHINGQTGGNTPNNQSGIILRDMDYIKKQIIQLKQQITGMKSTITVLTRQKQQQNNIMIHSKSMKINSNLEFQNINLQRKFIQDFSRIYQTIDQMRISTQDRLTKLQNNVHKSDGNNQILVHKINKAQQRIQSLESGIQNHMNLVNQQINNALTKIVASINQKISKALQNNVGLVNQKLKKCIQTCKNITQDKKNINILKPAAIEGKIVINNGMVLKLSGYRAEGKVAKIRMKSALIIEQKNRQKAHDIQKQDFKKGQYSPSKQSTSSQQIVMGNNIFYIDTDGYLMDQNKVYLLDQNNNLLQIQADKLIKIKQNGFLI